MRGVVRIRDNTFERPVIMVTMAEKGALLPNVFRTVFIIQDVPHTMVCCICEADKSTMISFLVGSTAGVVTMDVRRFQVYVFTLVCF